ncbi:clan AA aspartic protease [Flavobacterium branchiarum]|uniref:Clan AA aspartic protease n=1 Tax=Flavobacterium branchiarum TaxID=1114870 RepID=A0ABV5FK08_9FLAO|nr:clan AA aspartic protease [Flavobacterium branchiarum]MDN3672501.1 clan AA aspartic protease [Flavobacterium branchiarum]
MKYFFSSIVLLFLINSSFAKNVVNDTIPFIINNQNTIYVKAVFNKKDTLNLNFDTGTSELILTNDVLKNRLNSEIKLYSTFYNLKIGKTNYQTKVYDAQLSGHDTDGRFGWDFFKDKVVELNYDKNIIIVHSEIPKYVLKDDAYTKLAIKFFDNVFSVESIISQSGIEIKDRFLFDTGYQRTAMLDNDLLNAEKFPIEKMKEIKRVIMKGAQGNEIPVITSNLEKLIIGDYELKNVPIQKLTSYKPLKGVNIHILGNEVLKRFNTIFDFQNNIVYLKKNKLYNVEYIDMKKSGI